jgi:hypothetical protein
VQVVYIDTESPYLGKGWPLWRLPPLPIRFAVRLGPRLAPQNDLQAMVAALQSCFESELPRTCARGSTSAPEPTGRS